MGTNCLGNISFAEEMHTDSKHLVCSRTLNTHGDTFDNRVYLQVHKTQSKKPVWRLPETKREMYCDMKLIPFHWLCFNRCSSISSCQRRSELIGQMLCFLLNTRVWNWFVFVQFFYIVSIIYKLLYLSSLFFKEMANQYKFMMVEDPLKRATVRQIPFQVVKRRILPWVRLYIFVIQMMRCQILMRTRMMI